MPRPSPRFDHPKNSEVFPMETLYVLLIFPICVTCHNHPMLLNLIVVESSRRRVQIRPCRSPC
jgi:hypothetical protein